MVTQHGQHEDSGELVEAHECLHCPRTYLARDRALLLPESHDPGPWMTVEQILERRLSAVDRPEFLRHQPGLREYAERREAEQRDYDWAYEEFLRRAEVT